MSENIVNIRNFKQFDQNEVMKIFQESNSDAHSFLTEDELKTQTEICKRHLSCERTWVATKDGEIIGFICLIEVDKKTGDADDDADIIGGLYVKKECQRKGYGTDLMNYVKSLRDKLQLTVFQENEEALLFYSKQGFKVKEVKTQNKVRYVVLNWEKNG
jgi:putative acetyltransferase